MSVSPDLIPPHITYVHVCTLYTHTNTYLPRSSPSGFLGPSKCPVPTSGLTSSIYTHIHPRTFPPASKIEIHKTTQHVYLFPSIKNNPPRQATSDLHRLIEFPHLPPQTQKNKLRTHERMCTLCSDCKTDMYGNFECQKHLWNVYTCMHRYPGHLFSAHHAHRQNSHKPAHARPCDGAAMPLPCKPL